MNLTPEQTGQIASEVKGFAASLNLSPDQKEKLQTAFQDARGRLGDYMKDHPNTSKAEVVKELSTRREEMRQRVVKFLNPEQLKTWDTEIGKAKQFLGQKMDN
jgi:protein CpxP